jgi:hypothetical protein
MFKKVSVIALIVILCVVFVGAADAKKYSRRKSKRPTTLRVPGGANIPSVGLAIDASYDPRLDDLVPGYKVVNVALFNQSFNIIVLDPSMDKWWVNFPDGRKKKVLFDLRSQAPEVWSKLPEKAKSLIAYPLYLPVGARQVIDLFVPDKYNAAAFNAVILKLRSLPVTLEILASQ